MDDEMDDDNFDILLETYELSFVVGEDEHLIAYDNDRWHAVVMRQESEPRFANSTQRLMHVYFRGGHSDEEIKIEGLDAGDYEFMSDGCRKKTPEDLAFELKMANAIQSALGGEATKIDDSNIVHAENQFVDRALKSAPDIWQPNENHLEEMMLWIRLFLEQEEEENFEEYGDEDF